MRERYDVIIVGGGHAGTEAARAAADALAASGGSDGGGTVALVTMDPRTIGVMSCNPAIGGLAKGQMVREIDALGGLMGQAIDASGIMFRMLNTSRGAAVRGPRAQADKYAYAVEVQRLLSAVAGVEVIAGTVDDIVVEEGRVVGVMLPAGCGPAGIDAAARDAHCAGGARSRPIYQGPVATAAAPIFVAAGAVVLTTGTFMAALMHTGEHRTRGGRAGEGSADGMSGTLRKLGFDLGRLKTGTPPRLDLDSIRWDDLEGQRGDEEPIPFSDMTDRAAFPRITQTECRITHTTGAAHDLIRRNLDRAPMYMGAIDAESGPRYCPSIEDKVVRFADRESHHVFLEPESLFTNEVYCNGISTSLPEDVQDPVIRAMPGCEDARVLRYGYAVEYDVVWPHQIDATTMTKPVRGLFLAGQINGTSGYEEAGGQGLVAGLNAARLVRDHDLIRLGRDQAYIGVMLDDLVTKTPREPYRMFTSRAEHRLHLRADNSDLRLTAWAGELGLAGSARLKALADRERALEALRAAFRKTQAGDGRTLWKVARRPETTVASVRSLLGTTAPDQLVERVLTEARYEGYVTRQRAEVGRMQAAEGRPIPDWIDYDVVPGLRSECRVVLSKHRPATFGQAGRLAGVNPADLTLIAVAVRKGRTGG